jgi:hypothetical protein
MPLKRFFREIPVVVVMGMGQGSVIDPSKIHYGPEREGSYLDVDWNPGMDPGYTEPRAAADV